MPSILYVGNGVFVDLAVYARLDAMLQAEEHRLGEKLDVPVDNVCSKWVGESERGLMQAINARTYQLEIGEG